MPQFKVCLGIDSPIPACTGHLVCVIRTTSTGPLCIAKLVGGTGQGWKWQVGDWEKTETDVALYDQELLPAFHAALPALRVFITSDVLEDGLEYLRGARDQAREFFARGGQRAAQKRPGQA